MALSRVARRLLGLAMVLGLGFIYVPLLVVLLNSFNPSASFAWPPTGLTLQWWLRAADNEGVRSAVVTSLQLAALATLLALVLGTLASMLSLIHI